MIALLNAAAGYDPDTGMFGAFDARESSVPESPGRAEARLIPGSHGFLAYSGAI